MSNQSANLVSKISGAKLVNMKEIKKELKPGKPKLLYVVFGIAQSAVTGESQYGEYIAFKGSFEAEIKDTGEVYKSGKLFLPQIATDLLASAIEQAKSGEGFKGLQFAFEVGAVHAENQIGYEYVVKPLVEETTADPLADLRARALPAPAKEAAKPAASKAATKK